MEKQKEMTRAELIEYHFRSLMKIFDESEDNNPQSPKQKISITEPQAKKWNQEKLHLARKTIPKKRETPQRFVGIVTVMKIIKANKEMAYMWLRYNKIPVKIKGQQRLFPLQRVLDKYRQGEKV